MLSNENKVLGLIGIAKMAGKIVTGTEMTVDAVRGGKKGVKLLLCSADASQTTYKRIKNTAEYYKVPFYTLGSDKEKLAGITGRGGEQISVVGILDEGLSNAIRGYIEGN